MARQYPFEEFEYTPDTATKPTKTAGVPLRLWGGLMNRVKALSGRPNWYDDPRATLEDLANHVDPATANKHDERYPAGDTAGAQGGYVWTYDSASGGWIAAPAAAGGVTDHGALSGLSDDDHPQYQARSEKGAASGYAPLDAGSKIPSAHIPPVAITERFVVNSDTAQLALAAQEGDVAIRTDQSRTYIRNSGAAGTMADWTELATPPDAIQSVDGRTGTVSLSDRYAPASHKARHATGGPDALTPADIGAAASGHAHTDYVKRDGSTGMTGSLTVQNDVMVLNSNNYRQQLSTNGFNQAVWSLRKPDGSFIGVLIIEGNGTFSYRPLNDYSKSFDVDANGNVTVKGTLTVQGRQI